VDNPIKLGENLGKECLEALYINGFKVGELGEISTILYQKAADGFFPRPIISKLMKIDENPR